MMEMRLEHRLGTKEISRRTGVPVSTVHYWLKDHRLTYEEKIEAIRRSPRFVAPRKARHRRRPGTKPVKLGLHPVNSGRIGELLTQAELLKLDVHVTKGDEGDPVDFYVRHRDSLTTACLQVRCTSPARAGGGLPTISLRRPRGKDYRPLEPGRHFHFIVGFCRENGRHYVYHWKEVLGRVNCISVSDGALDAWWKVQRWLEGDESWLETDDADITAGNARGGSREAGHGAGRRKLPNGSAAAA